jgi:hypothetical protein
VATVIVADPLVVVEVKVTVLLAKEQVGLSTAPEGEEVSAHASVAVPE